MGNKRLISFVIPSMIILLVFLLLSTFGRDSVKEATSYRKNGLTVKQAYEKALSEAKKWDQNAELYYLTSVDNDANENIDMNGKRSNWNMHFAVPGKSKSLVLSISKEKITNFIEGKDQINKDDFIFADEIVFDSPQLLAKTKKEVGLLPGKDWAKGYNYTLKKYERQPIITIVGLSPNIFFAEVTWDPKSGKLISASHKVPSGGGVKSISDDKETILFDASRGGIEGLAVSNDKKTLIQWGYEFINSISPPSGPIIKYTELDKFEGGKWKNLSFPSKEIKGIWFGENNNILVVSESKVVVFENGTSDWKLLYEASSKILDVKSEGKGIVLLKEGGIAVSRDEGISWEEREIPEESVDVELIGHQIYILTSKSQIHLLKKDRWVLLPESFGKPIYISTYQDKLLASFSDGKIGFYSIGTNQWSPILKSDLVFVKLFGTQDLKNNFYAQLENGDLFKFYQKGNSDEWINKKVFSATTEGTIRSVIAVKDDLYISFYPSFSWKKISEGE